MIPRIVRIDAFGDDTQRSFLSFTRHGEAASFWSADIGARTSLYIPLFEKPYPLPGGIQSVDVVATNGVTWQLSWMDENNQPAILRPNGRVEYCDQGYALQKAKEAGKT